MPSTIPYDPTLALGNLVTQDRLDLLAQIAQKQSPADDAEDHLNDLLTLRRSFDMTIQELMDMSVDTADLVKQRAEINKQLSTAAVEYSKAKMQAEQEILPLKRQIKAVGSGPESPVDYNRTEIKSLPLSADSIKMNVQYFAYDRNSQSSQTHAMTLGAFVSEETKELGDSISSSASSAAQSQASSQHQRHEIAGTLVISATCTHKNAQVLAPFYLDVDKAIRVWNVTHPDQFIDTSNMTSLADIAKQAEKDEAKRLTLLSGAVYGSCFIGMVHVLDTTTTESSEAMYSMAAKLQTAFKVGSWIASEKGGFGVESSISNDAKNLLSAQNISSHCTLYAMGSIPSIKSNQVQMSVKGFVDSDGASSMAALAKLQNATASDQDSVDNAANTARTGGQLAAMKNATVTAALSALADIDKSQNNIIDTNSMMVAFEDYVNKALSGGIGVPIMYYTKPITRVQLAQMWVAKYFPGRFLAIAGDDTTPAQPAADSPAPAPTGG
ncbi:hypothetical protein [Mitsuaria sp. 7]|uniref:hypothetical protein n=1 Tax=Mitsuaria sp. 7 TaxID=1658665 RepID=UPI0007DCFBC8|nr:hypothetical protein [Mitsuaria sp. 7]ANH67699.1 hypothetical protein ABE85_09185 [Mitsuaria sp. 7]